ncbi:MAG: glycoside hydrolase family 130 protein [Planctomycetota bacterium]|jgi:predicted GH43/DUF377 family glycosyl hydrolase
MRRLSESPLISPSDIKPTREDLYVFCTINPAAVRFQGQTILLIRVGESAPTTGDYVSHVHFDPHERDVVIRHISKRDAKFAESDGRGYFYGDTTLCTSMSHLRAARSDDGVNFTIDESPALYPSNEYEAYGIEDARITFLEGKYYITYTAFSQHGVGVALAATTDFKTYERLGLIFPPYQKDVYLFPETVGGMYVCRHRPQKSEFNQACIWTARSPDLLSWGHHRVTLSPQEGTWQSGRVGGGASPIRTEKGWLEIYHAADENGRYCLGVMLSSLDEPEKLIACSSEPFLEPEAEYELSGVHRQTVFSNGLVVHDNGEVIIYYGAADTVCAAAATTIEEMMQSLKQ